MNIAERTRPRASTRRLDFGSIVIGVAFLGNGQVMAGLGDGSLRLICEDPKATARAFRPHAAEAAMLAMATDIDGVGVLTGGDDGRLMRTDLAGDSRLLTEFPGQQVDVLAVSPAGQLRAVAGGREIRLIDRDGRMVAATSDHPSTVTGLAFNPKGKRLAAAHYGALTLWWTGSLGRSPTRLTWAGSHIGASWSPDGTVVMSSMQSNELHGWRLADGRDMRMDGYAAKVRSMAWQSKPLTLLTAGADGVIGWRFTGGGPMGKPPLEIGMGLGRLVTIVSVNPRLGVVAMGFDDGRVALAAVDGDAVVRLRPGGDGGRITALAWSGDGKRLAAGDEAGSVTLFDIDLHG